MLYKSIQAFLNSFVGNRRMKGTQGSDCPSFPHPTQVQKHLFKIYEINWKLKLFVKVMGGGKEFHVHSTVKSVIKGKDMETISTICLWKMKGEKKGLKHQKCWDQTIPPTSFNTLRMKEPLVVTSRASCLKLIFMKFRLSWALSLFVFPTYGSLLLVTPPSLI